MIIFRKILFLLGLMALGTPKAQANPLATLCTWCGRVLTGNIYNTSYEQLLVNVVHADAFAAKAAHTVATLEVFPQQQPSQAQRAGGGSSESAAEVDASAGLAATTIFRQPNHREQLLKAVSEANTVRGVMEVEDTHGNRRTEPSRSAAIVFGFPTFRSLRYLHSGEATTFIDNYNQCTDEARAAAQRDHLAAVCTTSFTEKGMSLADAIRQQDSAAAPHRANAFQTLEQLMQAQSSGNPQELRNQISSAAKQAQAVANEQQWSLDVHRGINCTAASAAWIALIWGCYRVIRSSYAKRICQSLKNFCTGTKAKPA